MRCSADWPARGFADLRFGDGVIFQHLVENDLTVTDLADRMQVSQQAASKAVADLRARGWVRQQVDPMDAQGPTDRAHRTGPGGDRGGPADPRRAGRRNRALHSTHDLQAARRVLADAIARHGGDSAVRGRRVLPPR